MLGCYDRFIQMSTGEYAPGGYKGGAKGGRFFAFFASSPLGNFAGACVMLLCRSGPGRPQLFYLPIPWAVWGIRSTSAGQGLGPGLPNK